MPRIALNNKRGSSCLYDFLLFSKQSQRLGKTPTKQKVYVEHIQGPYWPSIM